MDLVFRWPFLGGIPWFVGACNLQQPWHQPPAPTSHLAPPAGGLPQPSLPLSAGLPWLRKIRRCHCYVMRSLYANISSCPELLGVQHATSPIWPSRYRKKTPRESGEMFFFFLGVVKTKNRSPFMANQIEIKRGYIYIYSLYRNIDISKLYII